MSADLVVYALVAAGLVFWLRSILGTRHGDEKSRHNPYASNPDSAESSSNKVVSLNGDPVSSEDKIIDLSESPTDILSVKNKTVTKGLVDISNQDKNFDIKVFLEGAQDAFVIIVEAFGEGDCSTLKNLLAPTVYKAFIGALDQREKDGETLNTEIHAIKKAEVIEAEVKDKTAFVTVRFTASETTVLMDKEDNILSGHPDKVTDMNDIWVFGRSLRSRDPRWFVYETRGDFEGDNETIPNSDE